MSIDITFEKRLALKDVLEKTKIIIIEYNEKKYLKLNNDVLHINDLDNNEEFNSISQYGLNSLQEIMKILVPVFQTRFITDNEVEGILHEQVAGKKYSPVEMDDIYSEITIEYGFVIDENGVIK